MKVETIYIAKDYKEFDNEQDCIDYEKFLDDTENIKDKWFLVSGFMCERTVSVINDSTGVYSIRPFANGEHYNGREVYQALKKLLKSRKYVKYHWNCKCVPANNGKTIMRKVYVEYELEKPCYLIETGNGGKDLRFPCIPEDLKDIEAYKETRKKKGIDYPLYEISPCRTSFAQMYLTELSNENNAYCKSNGEDWYYKGNYSLVDKDNNALYPIE